MAEMPQGRIRLLLGGGHGARIFGLKDCLGGQLLVSASCGHLIGSLQNPQTMHPDSSSKEILRAWGWAGTSTPMNPHRA